MDWFDELIISEGPPYWSLGVRHIENEEWLVNPPDLEMRLAEKRRLWKVFPSAVYAKHESATQSAVVEQLVDWLAVNIPGRKISPRFEPSLEWVAQNTAEDLILLERQSDGWVVTEGSLSFGFSWSIEEKIGLQMDSVHQPVAHYQNEIAEKVNQLFDRMPEGRTIARRNLGLTDSPELHLAPGRVRNTGVINDPGQDIYLRSERQTLRKIGAHMLFTIHSEVAPLALTVAYPALRKGLTLWIRSWDEKMLAYKNSADRTRLPALEWLAAQE
ncbi:MAG: hypothetical protein JW384_03137 [Nitrosomonadaceae bacterium]|nr:hypothetical protein [Nitrosomonadaceae bacterium]